MKYLSTSKETAKALKRLIKASSEIHIAVAWGSTSSPLFDLLSEHRRKIKQLTVGLHFYQTHPDFIKAFRTHSAARFVQRTDGVYHPKVYLFKQPGEQWDCICGSSNFTSGGLASNQEASIWISNSDIGGEEALLELTTALNQYAASAKRFGSQDLKVYRAMWLKQQKRLRHLSGKHSRKASTSTASPHALDIAMLREGWREYLKKLNDNPNPGIDFRLEILHKARGFFSEPFKHMPLIHRKWVAGTATTETLDWGWFGTTSGSGKVMQMVIDYPEYISDALDEIPLTGAVNEAHYKAFLQAVSSAPITCGPATATRLLSMKRPDTFICINARNRTKLSKDLHTTKTIRMEDYWKKIIAPIQDSIWWQSNRPRNKLERQIWEGRTAMLDARYYEKA